MQAIHETSAFDEPETVIILSEPMAYTHFGDIQCWNDNSGESSVSILLQRWHC